MTSIEDWLKDIHIQSNFSPPSLISVLLSFQEALIMPKITVEKTLVKESHPGSSPVTVTVSI